MRVFRYLCEEELKAILNGEMDNVGKLQINNRSNTHHYKQGVKYLHFFKHLEDLHKIRDIKRYTEKNFYVGMFDIPLTTLIMSSGKGYYPASGYDLDHETIREYAVPAEKVKPEHLVYYMLDNNRELTSNQVKSEIMVEDSYDKKRTKPQELVYVPYKDPRKVQTKSANIGQEPLPSVQNPTQKSTTEDRCQ